MLAVRMLEVKEEKKYPNIYTEIGLQTAVRLIFSIYIVKITNKPAALMIRQFRQRPVKAKNNGRVWFKCPVSPTGKQT